MAEGGRRRLVCGGFLLQKFENSNKAQFFRNENLLPKESFSVIANLLLL
jgi:hypothetical protein